MLSGRASVFNEERRLKDAFARAEKLDPFDSTSFSADATQHLVILVAGWMEQSAYELARAYCRERVSGPILSLALSHLNQTRNMSVDQLLHIVGRFDLNWQNQLTQFITESRKSSINSLIGLRNMIAHGNSSGARTSIMRVFDYFSDCSEVIHFIADIFDPVSATN